MFGIVISYQLPVHLTPDHIKSFYNKYMLCCEQTSLSQCILHRVHNKLATNGKISGKKMAATGKSNIADLNLDLLLLEFET